ncbi:MAG TPA: hypothetical protein VE974_07775 [Thermoanaerobaculia bacterium]|nr:hypothetical protein [Thermoanaerobaculia bacterium]
MRVLRSLLCLIGLFLAGAANAATRLAVTYTNDSGSGSLRQALLDAQTLCIERCTVAFEVTGTIRPLSQLPEVRSG